MILNKFKTVKEAEEELEKVYLNRVIKLDAATGPVYFKVNRISVDIATSIDPIVILTSNELIRYEVESCEFYDVVTIL